MGFTSIIGSGFLAAFALALGATNLQIGLLASIPCITQILQIAAVFLVEKVRMRKAITVISWVSAQLFWFPIAAIPFLVPVPGMQAVFLLLGMMFIRGLLTAVTSCGWNPWVRDLVPTAMLGNVFAQRYILTAFMTVIFGLGGAFFVDYWGGRGSGVGAVQGYGYVIAFGALFLGMASPLFMTFMPEPRMKLPAQQIPVGRMLAAPVKDKNFKWLLIFLSFWSFASNLALPFFSVFMLQKVGLPVSIVISLYVMGQFFYIVFLRIWGALVDKFGCKVILSLSASLYLLVILGWVFVLAPERYVLTVPLLILLHIFAGVASAGVSLTTGTIGLKLAPQEQATSYLSVVSLAINIGMGLGPLAGGFLADFFSRRNLTLTFNWTDPTHTWQVHALNITGFGFLFVLAFLLGLLALGILANLREQGGGSREEVLESLVNPMRELYRPITSVLMLHLPQIPLYRYLKMIPLPGLDVAFGVVAYQIADIAKLTSKSCVWCGKAIKQRLAPFSSKLKSQSHQEKEEIER